MPEHGEWVKLADDPPQEFAFGVIGRFWGGETVWETIDADHFVAFDEPGFAKIACSISVRPYGTARTLVSYEARTQALDPESRAHFLRYWRVVRPGVAIVMRAFLHAVAKEVAMRRPPIREAARAFGVVFGPSVVLDAAAGAALASAVHALRRHHRPSRAVALASGLVGAYLAVGRPLMLHWGATCEELRKPLPGDELVPDPPSSRRAPSPSTRRPTPSGHGWRSSARTAPASTATSGSRTSPAARCTTPTRSTPSGSSASPARPSTSIRCAGLPVARFEPGRVLALEGWGAFVLEPHGPDCTRLIARGRVPRGLGALGNALLMEIPHFVMERKMLLGIKERAERLTPPRSAARRSPRRWRRRSMPEVPLRPDRRATPCARRMCCCRATASPPSAPRSRS